MVETEIVESLTGIEVRVQNEKFLVEVDKIKEIYIPSDKIVPIPLAKKRTVGIIDIRGDIYSIISLKHVFSKEDSHYDLNKNSRLLLIEFQNLKLALLVDSVIGVRELPVSIFKEKNAIVKTKIDYRFIKLIGSYDSESFIFLNLRAIFQLLTNELEEEQTASPIVVPEIITSPKIKTKSKKPQKISQVDLKKQKSNPKPKPKSIKRIKSKKPKKSEEVLALSEAQLDMLREIGNIGCGNAVTALSRLIKKKIDVNLTNVGIVSFEKLSEQFGNPKKKVCGIFSHIDKPSQATILQVFDMEPLMSVTVSLAKDNSSIDLKKIKDKKDLDAFSISTITELGNILAGHYVSALGDLIGNRMMFDVPEFAMTDAGSLGEFLSKELHAISKYVIIIKTSINVIDLKLNGVFFFIPDLKTLQIFFNKFGIEDKSLESQIDNQTSQILSDLTQLKFTEVQRDALQEIGNIGAGNAANALAKMINKRVDINIPKVEMVNLDEYAKHISKKRQKLLVSWNNVTGITKSTILSIFKVSDIIDITSIIVDDKDKKIINLKKKIEKVTDFPELYLSAITELGHILGSNYASALGDLLNMRLMTDPPDVCVDNGSQLFDILKDEIKLLKKLSLVITTNVIVTDIKITGTFLFIPNLETLQELLDALMNFYK